MPDGWLIQADARHLPLRDGCVNCCVTSPPYWGLRDYGTARWEGGDPACDHRKPGATKVFGNPLFNENRPSRELTDTVGYRDICGKCGASRIDAQLGLEPTPDAYVANLVAVFRGVRRVLKDDGTVWLNLGDSYAGSWGNYSGEKRGQGGQRPVVVGSLPSPAWDGREHERPAASQKQDGLKPKDLVGIPWRVAFALRADGWYLRSDIIWSKPNPMPESVTDRPTKAHEYLFLLAKSERYYWDRASVAEPHKAESVARRGRTRTGGKFLDSGGGQPHGNAHSITTRLDHCLHPDGRNIRSVWTVATQPTPDAHFATFPEKLIEPCILAGCPMGGMVMDPFVGSGTTLKTAARLGRRAVGLDLNWDYLLMARKRSAQAGLFCVVAPSSCDRTGRDLSSSPDDSLRLETQTHGMAEHD